jgi:CheY-like chemotaxis protein
MPTILCVDDQEIGLATRRLLLETKGYEVLTATDGQTGLDLLATHEVAAVVVDYSMPELNGEEVARRIKTKWPTIAVIMLSGYPEIPQSAMEVADAFCVKGGSPTALLSELERLTGVRPTPQVSSTVERSRELMNQAQAAMHKRQQQRTSGNRR